MLDFAKVREEIERRSSKEAVKTAIDLWKKLKGDHRRAKINHFRDKFTVHLGEPKDIPLPHYRELFDFSRETTQLMGALALATNARTEGLNTWDAQISETAERFWQPWVVEEPQPAN